jgi:exopolysaccharide biosynthesis polyprenyl glycosylphosphotransferase
MSLQAQAVVTGKQADRFTRARSYRGAAALMVAVMDLSMFVIAAYAAEAIYYRTLDLRSLSASFIAAPVVFVLLWMLLFHAIGFYRLSFAMTVRDEVYVVVTALVLGIVPQFILFTLVPTLTGSRMVLLLAAAIATVSVGGARATGHVLAERGRLQRPRRVAVVGSDEDIAMLSVGLDLPPHSAVYAMPLRLESRDEIEALLSRCLELGCASILLASLPPGPLMNHLNERAATLRIAVRFVPSLRGGGYHFTVEREGMQLLLSPRPLRVRTVSGRFLKRFFDLIVASALLVVAAPVMIVAAIAVALETGLPIFYRQRRIGLDGRPFPMLKFRSMFVGHNRGDGWATRNDPRVTRVGAILRRLSIDELPQLINVLRGEMSVVGPRPEMEAYVERFEREIPRYGERHLVKPGITGWSQLYMDRVLTPDDARDVLRHDLFYIEHWGVFMDLSIVAKTAVEFLFHRAA